MAFARPAVLLRTGPAVRAVSAGTAQGLGRADTRWPFAASVALWVAVGCVSVGSLAWAWPLVMERLPIAIALMVCAALGTSSRIRVSDNGLVDSMGMGAVALSMLVLNPDYTVAVYGVWLGGVIVGCAWSLRSWREGAFTSFAAGASGAMYVLVHDLTPDFLPHNPVLNASGASGPIVMGFLAYYATCGVLSVLGAHLVDRVPVSTLLAGVGWVRLGIVFAVQCGSTAVITSLALSNREVTIDATMNRSVVAVGAVLLVIAVVTLTAGANHVQHLIKREGSLVEATMSMPWPTSPSVADQALDHMRRSMRSYEVGTSPGPGVRRRVGHGGLLIESSVIGEGEAAFRLHVRRKPWQRPFSHSDSNFLEALAAVARESLRVDREMRRLRSLSNTDPLTGLLNYRAFRSALADLGEQSNDLGLTALIFIDVDNFKYINDRYGHETGNTVLRSIAHRLRHSVGDSDVVARVGGDEFVILMTGLHSHRQVENVSGEIDARLCVPVDTDLGPIPVTITQGLSYSTPGQRDLSGLIEEADERMYAARGNTLLAGPVDEEAEEASPDEGGPTSVALTGEVEALRRAVAEGRISQVYQPIVDRVAERVVAVETLVRYSDPTYGDMSVSFILHECRRLGLMNQLATTMLTRALEDLGRFRLVAPELTTLNININVEQLLSRRFTQALLVALERNPDVTIVLELNESSLRSASEEVAQEAARFAAEHGVSLAIDDLGTAYSELAALVRFPVRSVKVDKRIIDQFHNPRTRPTMRSILDLGEQFGFSVVFEGVETPEQAEFLDSLGAPLAQGFLFGRPVSANEFLVRLDTMGLDLR